MARRCWSCASAILRRKLPTKPSASGRGCARRSSNWTTFSSPWPWNQRAPDGSRTEGTMGLLTFSINVTLDGCVDHQEGIADDETHAFFTRLMDEGGAMLWGRVTYEM